MEEEGKKIYATLLGDVSNISGYLLRLIKRRGVDN